MSDFSAKKHLRLTQEFENMHTERRNANKRNSVIVHKTERESDCPKFLTKKSINSPKYFKAGNTNTEKLDSVCNISTFSDLRKSNDLVNEKAK